MVFSRLLDELCNALRRLCAHTHPIIHAFQVQTQNLCLALGYWVEEAHALNETTVSRSRTVCNSDVIKRALLRTVTSQTDCYHNDLYEFYEAFAEPCYQAMTTTLILFSASALGAANDRPATKHLPERRDMI